MPYIFEAFPTATWTGPSQKTNINPNLAINNYLDAGEINYIYRFITASQTSTNDLSGNLNTLSGNLASSASIWNATSSSYHTLSGNLDTSASIWNAASGAYAALSNTLNTSGSKWNAVSSSFTTLSGNLDLSASIWNTASGAYAALSNSYVIVSQSVIGVAYLTSSNWNPLGGVFNITGSVRASGNFQMQSVLGLGTFTGSLTSSLSFSADNDIGNILITLLDVKLPTAMTGVQYTGSALRVSGVGIDTRLTLDSAKSIGGLEIQGHESQSLYGLDIRSVKSPSTGFNNASMWMSCYGPNTGTSYTELALYGHNATLAMYAGQDVAFNAVQQTSIVSKLAPLYIYSESGTFVSGGLNVSGGMTASNYIEITGTTTTTLYLHSPNGSRWAITVLDNGVLSSTLA